MLDALITRGIHYFEIMIRRGEPGSAYLGVVEPSEFQFNKLKGKKKRGEGSRGVF